MIARSFLERSPDIGLTTQLTVDISGFGLLFIKTPAIRRAKTDSKSVLNKMLEYRVMLWCSFHDGGMHWFP